MYIGRLNNFVSVAFDPFTSTITCTFLNNQDSSENFCMIRYGLAGEQLHFSQQNMSMSSSIVLVLNLSQADYDYVVTASKFSGTQSVRVYGRLTPATTTATSKSLETIQPFLYTYNNYLTYVFRFPSKQYTYHCW